MCIIKEGVKKCPAVLQTALARRVENRINQENESVFSLASQHQMSLLFDTERIQLQLTETCVKWCFLVLVLRLHDIAYDIFVMFLYFEKNF